MMDWKKIGKSIIFPHIATLIILLPLSAAFLISAMVFIGEETIAAYISYALAAYTLTIWCCRIPELIKIVKNFKNNNKYAVRYQEDTHLRVKISLYGTLLWNAAYAVFQLWLGFYHHTFWFYSIGAYYICLAIMRFFLLTYTRKYTPGEKRRAELIKYRACGWIFLVMNLALAVIIFFMLYWNRTFEHHMITAIAMAAYTFTSFTMAIVNVVRYRKYNSPVFSATKAISFASACVSMLTLTSTLLTTFSDGTMDAFSEKMMLGSVGVAVSVVVLVMAIGMIINGTKNLKAEVENGRKE